MNILIIFNRVEKKFFRNIAKVVTFIEISSLNASAIPTQIIMIHLFIEKTRMLIEEGHIKTRMVYGEISV